MHYTVYRITNKINGKVYIGKHQTKDLNDGYMGSGKLISRAIEKYGVENFSKEILFVFGTEELMNAQEAELVTEEFCLREDNYNICVGGQGGFSYINREGLAVSIDKQGLNQKDLAYLATLKRQELSKDPAWLSKKSSNLSEAISKAYSEGRGFNKINPMNDPKIREKHKIACQGLSKGEKNSQFGSMWITNGIENKKIKNVDNIPDGWYNGRNLKKGKIL